MAVMLPTFWDQIYAYGCNAANLSEIVDSQLFL